MTYDTSVVPGAADFAEAPARAAPKTSDIRIPALDGLRGLMTLFVIVSHYYGEVPSGIGVLCVGWTAVLVFFVLSGYLVGRLIVEKMHAGNFLRVFYLRRVCRTFPTYFTATLAILGLGWLLGDRWPDGAAPLPLWSYLVFLQNYFLIHVQSVGAHWLSPTWTLALEEQFYLVAPFLLMLTPRRAWLALMIGLSLVGLALRGHGVLHGDLAIAPVALLPTSADVLLAGMILAVLVKNDAIDWAKYQLHVRLTPILCMVLTFVLQKWDGSVVGPRFEIFGPFLMSIGAGAFILMLVKGAPEAPRFEGRVLRFFGNISYSVYLTHLAVLGLMHGLILGGLPDIGTPAQVAVTTAAFPVTVLLAWVMTKILEEPITEWGRRHRWA
ncbi:Peptidoglycan/LPS O-acetylase OafA/YrhL, contains acyltransferase and SGNH-hydrolase domains [Rhodoblastus acidophilus]|uniref:Peptidoglycan/LPS O-acetylase OafA/YrhL, contains acyltransferase and SGNH-hydrolase domains n=1 Tax=Rhodoblastus acidophilus TaxID=1074 RepID=A0A212R294_RHOAC|nr:acyltransferase [Rhodoblastus acidophilus]PPQ40325.1 acyltransferase [Rhodoblastus acidophilus]RAI16884.1 acyltransferase [Rhodoblastus acidophilus]SNB66107.1 Peptidoglycan/LPS O-acetylase OafA/YrhL, contains acyltransferase and SGNH-hydrolase domains [Rhodoblastus acidophilus]